MARDWPSHERHNVSPMRLAVNKGENALQLYGTSAQPLRLAKPSADREAENLAAARRSSCNVTSIRWTN
jgi:hypothetical protein